MRCPFLDSFSIRIDTLHVAEVGVENVRGKPVSCEWLPCVWRFAFAMLPQLITVHLRGWGG